MKVFGWLVLILVFVDEILCCVAAGVAGYHWFGAAGAVAGPLVVVAVWSQFASPRARFAGPVLRPVVKVLVFGLCSLGLILAGYPTWGVLLAIFSAVVNGLAQLPSIRALTVRPE